jgi:hypothetical protein
MALGKDPKTTHEHVNIACGLLFLRLIVALPPCNRLVTAHKGFVTACEAGASFAFAPLLRCISMALSRPLRLGLSSLFPFSSIHCPGFLSYHGFPSMRSPGFFPIMASLQCISMAFFPVMISLASSLFALKHPQTGPRRTGVTCDEWRKVPQLSTHHPLIVNKIYLYVFFRDSQVAPSIGIVRFMYEAVVQWWGVGGIHRYRVSGQS